MKPPIASPDGKGEGRNVPNSNRAFVDERAVSVRARVSVGATLRWSFKELLSVPLYLLMIFAGALVLAPETVFESRRKSSFLWAVGLNLIEFWILCFVLVNVAFLFSFQSRNRTLILTPSALIRREKSKDISIAWRRVLKVFLWSGDVLIVAFAGLTFVPREAFNSRDEARKFAKIARELCQSNGKTWRDEWNGIFFGAVPETARPNLPK